jgi:hypothetical protein
MKWHLDSLYTFYCRHSKAHFTITLSLHMPKVLQQSNHLEEVLIYLRVNGVRFCARIPKTCAKKAFRVQESFFDISTAVRENMGRIENAVWQKHQAGQGTDVELCEDDLVTKPA